MKKHLQFILGVLCVSIGFELFILPVNIVYGGVGGISILISNLYPINISLMVLILNIILLIISYFLLGKEKTSKSLIGSIFYPICLELLALLEPYFPVIHVEDIVLVIAGAVMTGTGMGLVLKAGYTTGGTDIISQLISKYFKISLGKAVFCVEGIIILLSLFILGISNFIYSVIAIYIISMVIDKVLLGISSSKTIIVITDKDKEVKNYITKELQNKITIIKAKGDKIGERENIIVCIVSTKAYTEVKNGILNIDKDALVLITDAYEAFNI